MTKWRPSPRIWAGVGGGGEEGEEDGPGNGEASDLHQLGEGVAADGGEVLVEGVG